MGTVCSIKILPKEDKELLLKASDKLVKAKGKNSRAIKFQLLKAFFIIKVMILFLNICRPGITFNKLCS